MEETARTPPAVPQTIVDRWIEFLDSGRYTQAMGYLHTSEGYCCMGVLVEAAGYEWGEVIYNARATSYPMVSTGDDRRVTEELILEWGIHPTWQSILIPANDATENGGKSANFPQIAAFLREHKAELDIPPVLPYEWNCVAFVNGSVE